MVRIAAGTARGVPCTRRAWEALCDRCGLCCVHKQLDRKAGVLYYTTTACRLLDPATCRCKHYARRRQRVRECVDLYALRSERLTWLPPSCAYRRLAEGKGLPAWHPLLTGDPDSTRKAGMSARDRVVPEPQARNTPVQVLFAVPLGRRRTTPSGG